MGQTHGAFGYSAEKSALDSEQGILSTVQTYFKSIHTCDGTLFHKMWHPKGHLLAVSPEGVLIDRDADNFCAGVCARTPSNTPHYTMHDRVLSVMALDDCTAAVKVQVALPPVPNAPTPTFTDMLYTDFLVLLKEKELGWRIISKIFCAAPLGDPIVAHSGHPAVAKKLDPSDFQAATEALWKGYFAAGRACNAKHMASVFHPASNLTYVEDGKLTFIDSKTFCEKQPEKYDRPLHAPYKHLRADPRIAEADTLVSLDFAGPGAALATVKIAVPPRLYTDFLSMVYLPGGVPEVDSKPGWWIVAKSCSWVPFMADETSPASKKAKVEGGYANGTANGVTNGTTNGVH
eukprot:gnl/MRDRNA2_/MRDRNA2_94373_c0_seq1.p1 gnl/MRDRNA2_/MRDRNA2_94373_c0~~gnl/MRDRNA2_/MRDRNA2_94373_c0_seq1.p1  ORF type:complete len:347 (-),score=65.96 gnl/MRDRNA2_/MRDRNA2_94373_c0_seq1:304-1344(-)